MISFLEHVPVWVPAVFVLLVAIGMRQMQERSVSTRRAIVMPLAMMAWSATKLAVAPHASLITSLAWPAAFAGTVLICLLLDYPGGIQLDDSGRKLRLPGSVLPLVLLMLIFVMRFVAAVMAARAPALAESAYVMGGSGLVYGLVSGLFFARAIAALRVMYGAVGIQRKAEA